MTAPPREPQSIYDALSTIYDWLCDDRLTQWPYMENGPFYDDLSKYQEVARAALAAAPAPGADAVPPCIERGCPNPSLMPRSEYCQYHATREPSAEPPAQAATDDLRVAAWLREWSDRDLAAAPELKKKSLGYVAADLIERQAREIAELHSAGAALITALDHAKQRAGSAEAERDEERAIAKKLAEQLVAVRAERDALRECVRAADAMRAAWPNKRVNIQAPADYDAARAKVR